MNIKHLLAIGATVTSHDSRWQPRPAQGAPQHFRPDEMPRLGQSQDRTRMQWLRAPDMQRFCWKTHSQRSPLPRG